VLLAIAFFFVQVRQHGMKARAVRQPQTRAP